MAFSATALVNLSAYWPNLDLNGHPAAQVDTSGRTKSRLWVGRTVLSSQPNHNVFPTGDYRFDREAGTSPSLLTRD